MVNKNFFVILTSFMNVIQSFFIKRKIYFRTNKIKSRRTIPDKFLNPFPVFYILSMLITSNYCPFFQIIIWKKNMRNM